MLYLLQKMKVQNLLRKNKGYSSVHIKTKVKFSQEIKKKGFRVIFR